MFRVALLALFFLAIADAQQPTHERIHRSAAARRQFKHENPCPSTGESKGPCPGYVIDHVIPLACGGPDESSNMQWQTVEDAKEKDKTERLSCGTSERER